MVIIKKLILVILIFLSIFTFSFTCVNASSTCYKAGLVTTSSSNLNVRKSASSTSSVVTTISKYSYVTILNESNNYYYVEYKDNCYGYVSKDYITIKSSDSKIVNTSGYSLNVRTGAGTNYSVFDKISDNEVVIVLSSTTNWSRVLFEGNKVGYVSNSYLTDNKYSNISLNVVSYKQYDSRWSSISIGSSGKTIKNIGCLITSLSMTESYRTNSTITPKYIVNNYSFTSDGSIYWPSNYKFITSSTNYLSKIYDILDDGKPVIIGLKNSTSTHYIVIYGYKASSSLKASNFLVNDPASSTNKYLSNVLTKYPNFIKLAYYK